MTYPFPADLQELVGRQMSTGRYSSEEDLLREALRALAADEEDLDAVREALAEWQAGDSGIDLDDAFAAVREKSRSDAGT